MPSNAVTSRTASSWSPTAILRARRPRRAPRHAVLTALYRRSAAGARCAACSRISPRSRKAPAKERGIILGRKAAADLLELHAEDGAGADDYRPFTQAGVYVPTQPVAGYHGAQLQAVGDDERGAVSRRAAAGTDLGNLDA